MRKHYNIIIPIIIIGLLILSYLYYIKVGKYQNLTASSSISYEEFVKSQEWEGDVLLAGDEALSINGLIYYTDFQRNISVPLCTVPDCLHNTDDCTAQFPGAFNAQFLYCYEDKLYVGGSENNKISFYRCDIDGSNHEKVEELMVDGDNVGNMEFYVYDSLVYIAVCGEDNSNVKVLDNGYITDVPIVAQIYCYNFETQKIQHVYTFPEKGYQTNLRIRYIRDNKIYYEYAIQEQPYEEIYDFETGQLKNDEYEKYEIEEVGTIDLSTDERSLLSNYETGDYIGCRGDIYYYEDRKELGNIRVENYADGTETSLYIEEMAGEQFWNCDVCLIDEGFAINVEDRENETSSIIFYDKEGNRTSVVEDCSMFICGDYGDIYMLSRNARIDYMVAYVAKEDIKKINTKRVYLWNEE